jgi:hypothetical protein
MRWKVPAACPDLCRESRNEKFRSSSQLNLVDNFRGEFKLRIHKRYAGELAYDH